MPSHPRLTLGELVAVGRTSEVHRCGPGLVAKVLRTSVPPAWADAEARFTELVRALGVAAPQVSEVTRIEGRPAIVFNHVAGPTMWSRMQERPRDVPALVRELVTAQRSIHAAGVADGLPSLVARVRRKLDICEELDDTERHDARRALASLPVGAALLHGDLHPGNVLLGDDGPVVIDWFDVTIGHPLADLARSALLIQPVGATDLRHLPGAVPTLVEAIALEFDQCVALDRSERATFETWRRLMAASRLAERTDADTSGLLAMWRGAEPPDRCP